MILTNTHVTLRNTDVTWTYNITVTGQHNRFGKRLDYIFFNHYLKTTLGTTVVFFTAREISFILKVQKMFFSP